MNKEIGRKWIAALRSGEYSQARNNLHIKDDGYCCLGVLCDLYIKETKEGEWENKVFSDAELFKLGSSVEPYKPPKKVLNWLGLNVTDTLINMNDSRRYSFNQIADYVESRYKLLQD